MQLHASRAPIREASRCLIDATPFTGLRVQELALGGNTERVEPGVQGAVIDRLRNAGNDVVTAAELRSLKGLKKRS